MERKDTSSHRNTLSIPCYINGRRYESLCAGAIDWEMSYSYLYIKVIRRNGGGPTVISGNTIVTERWLLAHPEYRLRDVINGEVSDE